MELKNKIVVGVLLFSFTQHFSKAQNVDSNLITRKNIIYIMPSAVGGDLYWDLDNFWIEVGYGRILNRSASQLFDLKVGLIAYSKSVEGGLLSQINAKNTKGFNINIEHRIILINKFYYSTNLFYQNTTTIRDGEIDYQKSKYLNDNNYKVIRNVYCVQPKIGFQFINKKNNMYTDVGLGIGIRYIQSYSINKINKDIDSGYETFANKEFDRGAKLAQKISLQIKIGYNF